MFNINTFRKLSTTGRTLLWVSLLLSVNVSAAESITSENFYSDDNSNSSEQTRNIKQSGGLNVYSNASKKLLQKVPSSAEYTELEHKGVWTTVIFDNPIITAWVSSDYIVDDFGVATVNVNSLNARNKPTLNSWIISKLDRGYTSNIVSKELGFVELYLPPSTRYSIKATNKLNAVESRAKPDNVNMWVHNIPEDNVHEQKVTHKNELPNESEAVPSITSYQEPVVKTDSNLKVERKHKVSPGDTLSLIVFGEADLGLKNARVPESGDVSFPLIGAVNIAGKTIKEIEVNIASRLAEGYIKNPKVSIIIDSYRPIFIKGAVNVTGAFPYSERLTVSKSLALAGGVAESADQTGVSISRDGKIVVSALSVDSGYTVESGDIIYVNESSFAEGKAGQYIYLHGEVNTPGAYEFRTGLTIEKAIVLAGGFSMRASRKKVTVSRVVDGEEVPLKMKRVELYMPAEPGDIIDVGASWF